MASDLLTISLAFWTGAGIPWTSMSSLKIGN